MRRVYWIFFCFVVALPVGCADSDQSVDPECLASRRCAPDDPEVCGVDGQTYECESVAGCMGVDTDPTGQTCGSCEPVACDLDCEYGLVSDAAGCDICQCNTGPPTCPDVMCSQPCPNGYEVDENGCQTCECIDDPPACHPLDCGDTTECPNGYETDDNGCQICQCVDDPPECPPVDCGGVECPGGYEVDQNGCQTCLCLDDPPPPTCPPVCDLYCPNGHKTDENGCELCECRGGEPDSCLPVLCGSQSQCRSQDELPADAEPGMSVCDSFGPVFVTEPLAQCEFSGAGCAARPCSTDDECIDGGLCFAAATAMGGHCVSASCQDIADKYPQTIDDAGRLLTSCESNADCSVHVPVNRCCEGGGIAVNTRGERALTQIDGFARQTSCGAQWDQQCATVRCVPPGQNTAECVDNTCQIVTN